jgi:hypothetical protein
MSVDEGRVEVWKYVVLYCASCIIDYKIADANPILHLTLLLGCSYCDQQITAMIL